MKNYFLILSSISIFSLSSNFINPNLIKSNNKVKNCQISEGYQSLFNNYYSYLSDDKWITNQSVKDNNFYSYDLSNVDYKLSNGVDAKTLFIVDSNGQLQYKSGINIPDKDKSTVDNSKTEMITNKKVTRFRSEAPYYTRFTHTAYSFSTYGDKFNNECFINDKSNSNWTFVQFGGIESHIDISSQDNSSFVTYYKSLSEDSGLYYIAQAVIEKKIDEKIAHNLGQYFISQSSLKDKINASLTNKIIDLIVNNSAIYNNIYYDPFYNSSKNYSLNFIFDSNNNLIELYYNSWNKENQNKNINYSYSGNYNFNNHTDHSNQYVLLNWHYYAADWVDFIGHFPTFYFDSNSYIIFGGKEMTTKSKNFNYSIKTSDIKTQSSNYEDNSFVTFNIEATNPGVVEPDLSDEEFNLDIWHNNDDIIFQWQIYSSFENEDSFSLAVALKNITFNNSMN